MPREVASCLYRVAQQSLQNAAEHGRARRISAGVTERDGRLTLTVADDRVVSTKRECREKAGWD